MERNKEIVFEANRDVGLEVNTERAKYMFMPCYQNAEHHHNLLTVNKSFKMWKSSSNCNNSKKNKFHS
jgi:hypothetical protein